MNRIAFRFFLWMYFLATSIAHAEENPFFLKPTSCGPKTRASSEYIKELNHRFRTTFGHGPGSHDAVEEKIVADTFRAQGKEVLCEMLAFEALSPYGWHGDTSKKEEPTGAAELAKSLGLEDFYKKTRQAVQVAKQKIQNTFNKHVENGLVRVAEKMQDLQSAQGRLNNEKEIIKERQALEETFRKELPYANHPFLRDYYNFIITHTFNKATHPTRADLPGRVRMAMQKSKSFLEVETLRSTRSSLEGEAKVYDRMQTLMRKGGGDGALPDPYRITLGQLGAFSGTSDDPKENSKLKALDSWYNSGGRAEVSANAQIAASVADLGVSMVPVVGDIYSVGTEVGRFAEQIKSCDPEYPMGFRTGICESLQSMSGTTSPQWTADFFGSAPDLINCNWKTAMQAGVVLVAAAPFANKGLKVLRARRALKAKNALAAAENAVEAGKAMTAAESTAARASAKVSDEGSTIGRSVSGSAHRERKFKLTNQQIQHNEKEMDGLNKKLKGLKARKLQLEDLLKKEPKGPLAKERDEYLTHIKSQIFENEVELSKVHKRVSKQLALHNKVILESASTNASVKNNPHLRDHFLPSDCDNQGPNCLSFLDRMSTVRKNKLTTFFPKGTDLEPLLETAQKEIPHNIITSANGLTSANYYQQVVNGHKFRFAVIVCQKPSGCSNSPFGGIDSIFPVCGPGLTHLVEGRLKPTDLCK